MNVLHYTRIPKRAKGGIQMVQVDYDDDGDGGYLLKK